MLSASPPHARASRRLPSPPELVTDNKNTAVPAREKEERRSKFRHTKKESDDGYGGRAEEEEEARRGRQGWRTQRLWRLQAQGNAKRKTTMLRLSCHCLLVRPPVHNETRGNKLYEDFVCKRNVEFYYIGIHWRGVVFSVVAEWSPRWF
jgi:hypothetical protein